MLPLRLQSSPFAKVGNISERYAAAYRTNQCERPLTSCAAVQVLSTTTRHTSEAVRSGTVQPPMAQQFLLSPGHLSAMQEWNKLQPLCQVLPYIGVTPTPGGSAKLVWQGLVASLLAVCAADTKPSRGGEAPSRYVLEYYNQLPRHDCPDLHELNSSQRDRAPALQQEVCDMQQSYQQQQIALHSCKQPMQP